MSTVLEEAAWMIFSIICSGVGALVSMILDVLVPLIELLEKWGIKL